MTRDVTTAHAVAGSFQAATDDALDLEVVWPATLLKFYKEGGLSRSEYLSYSDVFSQYFSRYRKALRAAAPGKEFYEQAAKREEVHAEVVDLFDRLDLSMYPRDKSEIERIPGIIDTIRSYYSIGVDEPAVERAAILFPLKGIAARLEELDRYSAAHPGKPISGFLLDVFPELKSTPLSLSSNLPTEAPAFWARDKLAGETPPAFIKRHYAPWLGKGLARPDVKRLDPQLYVALSNWLRKNEMPKDVELPTLKERNDLWVEQIEGGGRPSMGDLRAREASRIRTMISRRRGRA